MQVAALWRYPVKSLQGEPVDRAWMAQSGLAGDRAFGVRDATTGVVLSAKREPRLLQAAARAAGEGLTVATPVGTAAGRAVDALLSGWLGRTVTITPAPGGPYVDEADLHLVTRAELADWDVRRFRPNIVVDGADDLDDLVGERIAIGAAVVEVSKRTKRCAMPTLAQSALSGPALRKDTDVLRALAHGRDLRLGVYARVVVPGVIESGAGLALA